MPTLLDYTYWTTNLSTDYLSGVDVVPDSRKFVLANQRIDGDVVIGQGCSQYELSNLLIFGKLVIQGLNWHGLIKNVWVIGADGSGIKVGFNGPGGNCNAMNFQNVFAQGCAGKGWEVYNQSALCMTACAADMNVYGGFLFNGVRGDFRGLTAESNQGIGIHFYDSRGTCAASYVDPPNSIVVNGDSDVRFD